MTMVVLGAASSGGVAAVVFKKVRARNDAEILTSQPKGVENAAENRIAQ
jgi:hypothetical protein